MTDTFGPIPKLAKTTFQREKSSYQHNLGTFSIIKQFYFIFFNFELFQNLYPLKKCENIRKCAKKNSKRYKKKFRKKNAGSDTDTKIGPWFRFQKLKTGFGR